MKKSNLLFLGGVLTVLEFVFGLIPGGSWLSSLMMVVFFFYVGKLSFKKKIEWVDNVREKHPYFDIYMNALGYVFYVSAIVFLVFVAVDYYWDVSWRGEALIVFSALYLIAVISALVYATVVVNRQKRP